MIFAKAFNRSTDDEARLDEAISILDDAAENRISGSKAERRRLTGEWMDRERERAA